MPKKTKAQRAATRKAGWQQAGQGAKTMLKANAGAVAQLARDVASGAIAGLTSGKKTMVKGIGENVAQSVREGNYKGKTNLKGAKDVMVGIAKGIFNDPSFYDGWLKPVLAYNDKRPFEPEFTDNIDYLLAGLGVGYVVDTNVDFVSLLNNEAAEFSVNKIMQQIRENLKSNLPYTTNKLKAYIYQSISIAVLVTQIERNLSTYSYFDATAPKLNDALKRISNDIPGFNDATQISYLVDQEQYAYALSRVDLINALINEFMVPPRMLKFIKHYFGSIFADQTAKHAQLYRMNCVSVPLYSYDSTNDTVSVSGTLNPNNIDLDELVSIINNTYSIFGIQIADLKKDQLLQSIPAINVKSPDLKCDKSFFNLLVNAYTTIQPTGYSYATASNRTVGSSDAGKYFRVDFMEDLPIESRIDTVMGLGTIIGKYWSSSFSTLHDVHFLEVKSQSLIFYATTRSILSGNDQFTANQASGTTLTNIPLETITTEGFKCFTINSDIVKRTRLTAIAPSSTPGGAVIDGWNLSNPTGLTNDTSTTIYMKDGSSKKITVTVRSNEVFYPLFEVITNSTSSGYVGKQYGVAVKSYGNGPAGAFTYRDVTNSMGNKTYGALQNPIYMALNVATLSSGYGYDTYEIEYSNASESVSNSNLLGAIRGTYSVNIINNVSAFNQGTVTRASGSTSTAFGIKFTSEFPQDMISWFIEVVDYHIPLWIQSEIEIDPYVGTTAYKPVAAHSIQFAKECYIPVMLNLNDTSYTLYDMVMSLVAPNSTRSDK